MMVKNLATSNHADAKTSKLPDQQVRDAINLASTSSNNFSSSTNSLGGGGESLQNIPQVKLSREARHGAALNMGASAVIE